MKKIKNNKEAEDVWVGMTIQPGELYEIQQTELVKWQTNSKVISDIANGYLILNIDGSDIADVAEAVNLLLDGDREIRDSDNALTVRTKMAPLGWTYHGHAFEFTTATLSSVFDKDPSNSDWGWCTIKLYNASNSLITDQTVADSECVKTVVDWEPPVDFELIGGDVRCLVSPETNVRFYAVGAPDIPAAYGGSKVMISGVNFKFLLAKTPIHTDGRVSKRMQFNATDHRGKLRFTVRHDVGVKIDFMALLEGYKQ